MGGNLETLAGWSAPIATAIAAIMTASNLSARVTGWGFVVFTIGSLSWSVVGLTTGQTTLLMTNGFLTLVNMLGVWRWLGRQAHYEDIGQTAVSLSETSAAPTLVTAGALPGMSVHAEGGESVGTVVEAMLDSDSGRLRFVVVGRGGVSGIGEALVAIDRGALRFRADHIDLAMTASAFQALPAWAPGANPAGLEDPRPTGKVAGKPPQPGSQTR
ncbi:PRC-barrel domain-containing protein [Rhodospirillum rubrum]|uniref:PRC-barrel domain-containing protein n=1 Tax=Rhodospirillum rubrum TaxID=1085 RepID=UPI001F5B4F79|nr:PRC-barrel domain-containing protein [Rhodospirillum rubrum]